MGNHEVKIARVMNEVNAPMAIYQMTPNYYGADIIGVTTVEKYKEMLLQDGENLDDYQETLDNHKDYKYIILPGFNNSKSVRITKSFGHFINEDIEDFLSTEGYVIINLGDLRKTRIDDN